jgi:hypothetical protein
MRLPCCLLSIYPPLSTFECLNHSIWNLVCISWHLSPSQWRTSYIPPISQCIRIFIPLSLLGNGLTKTLPRQRVHAQQQNCWTRRFLCGSCPIKGKSGISSPHHFLFSFLRRTAAPLMHRHECKFNICFLTRISILLRPEYGYLPRQYHNI